MIRAIFLLVLIVIAGCTQSTKKGVTETKNVSNEIKEGLPPIDIVTTSGDSINFSTLEGRLILILFNSDCDHCQRQAADISNHFELFKDYRIFFVAAQTSEVLKEFAIKYNLSDKPNVVFSQGPIVPVVKLLKPTSMPTILIYDEDGALVRRFDGETDVETIAEFL